MKSVKNIELAKKLVLYSGILDIKPIVATAMHAGGASYEDIANVLGTTRQNAFNVVNKIKKDLQ